MTMRGDLTSFKWMELDHLKYWPASKDENQEDPVLCHVHYAALNFKSDAISIPWVLKDKLKRLFVFAEIAS